MTAEPLKGAELRQIRKDADLSLREMAAEFGMGSWGFKRLREMEKGRREIPDHVAREARRLVELMEAGQWWK